MIHWLFLLTFTAAQAAGPGPNELLCHMLVAHFRGNVGKALEWVDGQITARLGPVKLDPGKETTETILKAAEVAAYLLGEGADPVEKKLLADAREKKIVVELSDTNQADPSSPRVWLDRMVVTGNPEQRRKILRHELSHKLYHKPEYLTTGIPEWIFIREVDANLYAGNSLVEAVRITFENYGVQLGGALEPYSRKERRGDYMAIARNIFNASGSVVADFDLLEGKLQDARRGF